MKNGKKGMNAGDQQQNNKHGNNQSLTPQQLAVIVALLTKVLKVRAVVLDVEQNVEVILQGNLKSKEINKLLCQLNHVPVEKWLSMLQKFNDE
ncbi:hypothetical protein CR194_02805 [Salipaludibacillus keqinensis]|uniref:Uncharacterized protein n=1 Tax=Salipaludibacillus keqinensis TaxID=2045207 RepID=A0A323TI76_9BACI|nr:hypothetical protein [Salipaludibacillus keqinensis]PYZ94479.1 hypothetical protein CR194_02805 [Salipaludibacillus keqinensis]